jgi:2'-5' RNA ligase
MSMRMFVALLPPEQALTDLELFAEPRWEADGPLRWTDPTQWHVTLAFLPAVADADLDELCERLTETADRRAPFELQLFGAGTFPNPARAAVLWLGVHGDTERLSQLATGTRNAAARSGVEVDGSRFRPHLTLARVNRPIDVTRWLRIFDAYRGPVWSVSQLALVQSHLGQGPRGRPRYEVRDTFALAAQP